MNVCNPNVESVLLLDEEPGLPFGISIEFNAKYLVFVYNVRYEGELGVEWVRASVALILSWTYDLHDYHLPPESGSFYYVLLYHDEILANAEAHGPLPR